MSFTRKLWLTVLVGVAVIGFSIILVRSNYVSENMGMLMLSAGAFLVWLGAICLWFRFHWSLIGFGNSALYGGALGENARKNCFSRWFIGLKADGTFND